jgi:plasmid replication initiation protein
MEAIKDKTQQPVLLNNAVHEFDVLEKRIFYIVVNQIKKGFGVDQDMFNNLWFEVPTSLIGTQHYEKLKEVANNITSRKIRVFQGNEQLHVFVPFPEVKYQKRWGHLKIRLLDTAYPYLAELQDGYFWYRLKSALLLSRTYSQRFYEFFSQFQDTGIWKGVTIEYIRTRLALNNDKYSENFDFVKRVVHDSIEEINEKTDISVEISKYHKKGKKIIGFDFRIAHKEGSGEAKELKKIEKYYKYLEEIAPADQGREFLRIKKEYGINDAWYNILFDNKHILDEVIRIDKMVRNGQVYIKTSKEHYMNGCIKKLIDDLPAN